MLSMYWNTLARQLELFQAPTSTKVSFFCKGRVVDSMSFSLLLLIPFAYTRKQSIILHLIELFCQYIICISLKNMLQY